MKYNINSDIPLPPSILKSHKKQIRHWYEYHLQESTIPPYQFYYNGHLISLAFETTTTIEKEKESIMTPITIILSTIVLVLSTGVILYHACMS